MIVKKINRLYSLEQFQGYRTTEQEAQKVPIILLLLCPCNFPFY